MSETLFEYLALYGLPIYFVILVISSAGVPFPITIMLIVTGAFVAGGDMELSHVLALGTAGAVIGDNIGYAIGKYGGRRTIESLTARFGGAENIQKAEDFAHRWGGTGIFFSRWLITPLGPWISITSGISGYPWGKFFVWAVAGEFLWVLIYVSLGLFFSEQVQFVADMVGNLSWFLVGLTAVTIVAWLLFKSRDRGDTATEA